MIKCKKIKTQIDKGFNKKNNHLIIGGWYQGKETYMWFGTKDNGCVGVLSGHKLHRLAKTIVNEFNKDD